MHYSAMSNNFSEMEDLLQHYAQVTGRVLSSEQQQVSDIDWLPAVDIQASKHCYHIRMELAGVDKSDINISYCEGKLAIEGVKHAEMKTNTDSRRQCSECLYGRFYRCFALGGVEYPEQIEASYNNGILSLTVPRHQGYTGRRLSIDIA